MALTGDRKRRCAAAGAAAEAELSNGNTREAWQIVRSWYQTASTRPPPPSREDLTKVTNDRISLYTKELPPESLPILVAPYDIDDVVPEVDEIAEAVRRLRNGKAPEQRSSSDKILESLVTGTKAKPTVTSRYLKTTVSNNRYHQASYANSQLRLAILRIANPKE